MHQIVSLVVASDDVPYETTSLPVFHVVVTSFEHVSSSRIFLEDAVLTFLQPKGPHNRRPLTVAVRSPREDSPETAASFYSSLYWILYLQGFLELVIKKRDKGSTNPIALMYFLTQRKMDKCRYRILPRVQLTCDLASGRNQIHPVLSVSSLTIFQVLAYKGVRKMTYLLHK